MVRSLSQKDSLIIKKKLHNTLYSFKNLFTDEDDNNKNNEEKQDENNYNSYYEIEKK